MEEEYVLSLKQSHSLHEYKVSQTFLRQTIIIQRGERMRKMLVILLVIGFMIGTYSAVEGLCEESSVEQMDLSDRDAPESGAGDPTPCGGGEGSGAGGGQPG